MTRLINKITSLLFTSTTLLAMGIFLKPLKALNVDSSDSEPEFKIHQLALNYNLGGDCCFIEYGETDILIDAGGGPESKDIIEKALDTFVTDGCLEYVIFTHADEDHILYADNVLKWQKEKFSKDSSKKIQYLIDFDFTQDKNLDKETIPYIKEIFPLMDSGKETAYSKYSKCRKSMIKKGVIEHYYPASACFTNEDSGTFLKNLPIYADPVSRDSCAGQLEILNNYFYSHPIEGSFSKHTAAAKNTISVCTLITMYGSQSDRNGKFLFTGDLEEYDSTNGYVYIGGESKLINNNNKDKIKNVTYYKAAHHGAKTSNSPRLMDVIRPRYIGISTCAGNSYGHPSDDTVSEMTKWTDYIYITQMLTKGKDGEKVENYYGNIHIYWDKSDKVTTKFTPGVSDAATLDENNNDTNFIKISSSIFNTTWFKANRRAEVNIFNLDSGSNKQGSCVYIKFGHYDVLVNAGVEDQGSGSEISSNETTKVYFKNQIESLCVDRVLDHVIISNCYYANYSDFIRKNGIFDSKYFDEITNIYYSSENWITGDNTQYPALIEKINASKIIKNRFVEKDIFSDKHNHIVLGESGEGNIYCTIDFLDCSVLGKEGQFSKGLPFVFTSYSRNNKEFKRYLNLADIHWLDAIPKLLNAYPDLLLRKITIFQLPYFGYLANSAGLNYIKRLAVHYDPRNPEDFIILENGIANERSGDSLKCPNIGYGSVDVGWKFIYSNAYMIDTKRNANSNGYIDVRILLDTYFDKNNKNDKTPRYDRLNVSCKKSFDKAFLQEGRSYSSATKIWRSCDSLDYISDVLGIVS